MRSLSIRDKRLDWGARTFVMGILNITPDSFSGDGLLASGKATERALKQARDFLASGCDILDVGGESTRPGAETVSVDEETERVVPFIRALRRETDALISIDTYKSSVAEAALQAGADIINDVWALQADAQMAALAACFGAPLILMHNRSNPNTVEVRQALGCAYTGAEYNNLLEDVKADLSRYVSLALAAGVQKESIILDPGIGFGKSVQQNLELINRLGEISALGFPLLLGPSRKSFIGYTLNLPPDQREEGTAAAIAVGITRGADIIRVHDVENMTRVARMTDAIIRKSLAD